MYRVEFDSDRCVWVLFDKRGVARMTCESAIVTPRSPGQFRGGGFVNIHAVYGLDTQGVDIRPSEGHHALAHPSRLSRFALSRHTVQLSPDGSWEKYSVGAAV